ncbi:hypothetical protein CO683_00740 [Bradyrhizobium ottawaense]|uniref:hypothetical protein n=1 Tax=Bradyrhizobium ottawaense TaxID=931866 RepID=UPI000BEA8318|nr:hypothetical protein [Bradyrhizobium ottawaense]PDT71719.1 hypothetical protein CO683_00740 [Bradyrhizobium ottawaense]
MTLTPKNWKSFQHYKDRAPAWIKLHKGLMTDFAFNRLPLASRALAPMLWLLASEYEDGEITASVDEIAFRLHVSTAELNSALKPLIDSGFFIASDALAEPEQQAIPEKEDIGKRTRKEEEKEFRAASPSNEDFENFKKDYPKRAGNYGWKAAERKYLALVKTGVSPKAIQTAVRRHAEEMRKLKRIGTEFVPMPASWLNSEDFVFVAVDAFSDGPKPIDWDNVLTFYKQTKVWMRDAGPDPDSPACRAPPELLDKYGLRTMQ